MSLPQAPLQTPTPWRKAIPRLAVRVAVFAMLLVLARLAYDRVDEQIHALDAAAQARALVWITITGVTVYALLIALPFVPGIEIGLALMMLEGARIAPVIYAATVFGLILSFAIGQHLPVRWLQTLFRDLHMMRAVTLLDKIEDTPREDRLNDLQTRLPKWLAPFATRYRYLCIAVLLNVPGNAILGGGGGIMLLSGVSRLFATPLVLLTVAIAVAPVPILVWFWGTHFLLSLPAV